MEDPFESVRKLVQEISGRQVGRTTLIWHDLHLAGDDVDEMLERLSAEFGTSFRDLPFTDYFPEEHEALGAHLAAALHLRSDKRALTVQHLAAVVARGAWFEPAAN